VLAGVEMRCKGADHRSGAGRACRVVGAARAQAWLAGIGLARIFHQQQVGGLVPKRVFIGICRQ